MSAPDISREAVEQRATMLDRQTARMILALRAALDAAERERDEARADMEKSAKATRRAVDQMAEAVAERDAAAVTHYARGVQDAASLAHNQRSYSVAEIVSAILALLPKEKNDAE